MRLGLVIACVCLSACSNGGSSTASSLSAQEIVADQLVAAGRVEVDRIAASCDPTALAELVTIASGAFDPPSSTSLRCRALIELRYRLPLPHPPIWAVSRRYAEALDTVRPAVLAMLDDDQTKCGRLSPRTSMVRLLIDVPEPSVRSRLEELAADDAAAHRENGVRVAIRVLDDETMAHEGSGARLVDTTIAPGTPAAFEDLIELLAAERPSPEETVEVDQHVEQAFRWLMALARRDRPDEPARDKDWQCQRVMRTALETGSLGHDLLAEFERLTLRQRWAVLDTIQFLAIRPLGLDAWLADVAAHDPDPVLRQNARVPHKR